MLKNYFAVAVRNLRKEKSYAIINVVGLAIGLLQALTQVQEQTVAFVPKLVAMLAVMAVTLPWMLTHLVDYWTELIMESPNNL